MSPLQLWTRVIVVGIAGLWVGFGATVGFIHKLNDSSLSLTHLTLDAARGVIVTAVPFVYIYRIILDSRNNRWLKLPKE